MLQRPDTPAKENKMLQRHHFMMDLFDAFVADYEEKTGASFNRMTESELFQAECYKAFRGGATYDQALDHLVKYTMAVLV